jgi:hypothetical protein
MAGMTLRALAVVMLALAAAARAADVPPTGAALGPWLEAGHYKHWRAESGVHASAGPHFGKVRAYLNPVLFGSMQSDAARHPQGAAAVKELYGAGETVKGWAVYIKTGVGDAGTDWYWYEKFDARVVADGQGVLLCRSCHFTGRDYVLTPWPLK